MKITILGSGTSTGVPMVGCRCNVCTSTDRRDKRTRASILVETEGHYLLVDTSTDLRKQAIRAGIPHIDAVFFTHAHADHIHGIDDMRGFHFIHKRVIPCYGERETMEAIMEKFPYIFDGLERAGYAKLLQPHIIEGPVALAGCRITPVPLRHGSMPATGYRFNDAAYLTDCSLIPDTSLPLLENLELLIIDGLRYTPHPHHFNIDGALDMVRKLNPKRAILTHLTHEVPYSDGRNLPPGIELAYDGLSIDCS
ncbi:GPMC system MBL fold metallohydrolase [Geobacter sp. DSM 9736]|uniref:GPMC system MBL fold metallohydrolase n=1 Tax=Geobacter sp. DSM 9736 TaxID=1277350 RepID=UPI000B513342|nr:GPMC system MBL fold metallohydrolase [Geobacter sp. DSM 9736]SNB47913.1 phosphoribosyl 1,2-cyclic phosphate phosphodiesterase [Geobacter sp. DSM 9736]